MSKTYLKAGDLIGYRLRTLDEQVAALRDLVIDLEGWLVRYLTVDAAAWPARDEVLVAPRSVAGVDEARREVKADLSFEQVRNSPTLSIGAPVTRGFEENFDRYYGWEDRWQAEIDAEAVEEPPIPTAPPAEEPQPSEADAETPGLVRLEALRGWQGETADGAAVWPEELLLDDADWSVAYVEFALDAPGSQERALLRRNLIDWADPVAQRLYLAIDGELLRRAPRKPYPAGGEAGRRIHVLEDRKA